jgi:hypothetical protein
MAQWLLGSCSLVYVRWPLDLPLQRRPAGRGSIIHNADCGGTVSSSCSLNPAAAAAGCPLCLVDRPPPPELSSDVPRGAAWLVALTNPIPISMHACYIERSRTVGG